MSAALVANKFQMIEPQHGQPILHLPQCLVRDRIGARISVEAQRADDFSLVGQPRFGPGDLISRMLDLDGFDHSASPFRGCRCGKEIPYHATQALTTATGASKVDFSRCRVAEHAA